jgi:hypothetical protein
LGCVATNRIVNDELAPVADAVITAGPAVVEEMLTVAVPVALVVAVVVVPPPVKVPRVVENDTA